VYELDKAIELEPFLTEAHYLLGIVYQRAGQTDKAIEELRKAIYIDKDCVLSYFGLACIYQSNGIKSDATREYSNAVRVLGTLRDDEIIQFSGGLTARILMQACQKRIEELSD
jgi:chemotaxis protein methyltransferase CheR